MESIRTITLLWFLNILPRTPFNAFSIFQRSTDHTEIPKQYFNKNAKNHKQPKNTQTFTNKTSIKNTNKKTQKDVMTPPTSSIQEKRPEAPSLGTAPRESGAQGSAGEDPGSLARGDRKTFQREKPVDKPI